MMLGDDPGRLYGLIRTGRRDRPVVPPPSIALRVAIIAGIAVVCFCVILFRLWFLQVLNGSTYLAEADNNRLRSVKTMAPRGSIVDRDGKVIVENRPGLAVGIRLMDVPTGRLDAEVVRLASVLGMRPAKIRSEVIAHLQPSWPASYGELTWAKVCAGEAVGIDLAIVKEDVGKTVRSYLLEHDQSFPGVEIQQDYLRSYPHGDLAAQLLGNVGEISADELKERHFRGYSAGDVVGQSGLEWTYDKWLRGHDGVTKVEVDAQGQPKSGAAVSGDRLPEAGDTLVTTLDSKVQAAAQKALVRGIQLARGNGETSADGGAAVVLNAKNGEVLAMASEPTYDPSVFVGGLSTKQYGALADSHANYPLLDRPIQEAIATGSTFKPIDSVAALEEGVITPSSTFYCPGSFTVDKLRFNCWLPSGHGSVSLIPALAESCDVYFYNVGYKFYLRKGTELEDWAKRLGLGKSTGIDIPGETAGRVPTPAWKKSYFKSAVDKIWEPGDSINLAIGQGNLEATPLQMAVAYAAIANGGTIVTPHLGLKVVGSGGRVVETIKSPARRRLDIAQSTLDAVRQGLYEAANSSIGTSSSVFADSAVKVAGKTGTAEVFGKQDYAWYASYAPADDPKYVVVVMIEQGGHGGVSAAPAARMIYDALFHQKSSSATNSGLSD